ncbi:MAG: hypothetical protein GY945_12615 [Rhodobacteraceae bacterium]|nr:hypothetical protein [Paracoccaceae bacterium]
MEYENHENAALRQVLRLAITLYFMAVAMGILPNRESTALLQLLISETTFAHYIPFSAAIFAASYFILIGRHLRLASGALIAFTILARLNMALDGFQMALVRDAALVASLMLTGGWFTSAELHQDAPGRIRLTRVSPPTRTRRSVKQPKHTHAFTQSPDDLECLFDQLGEVG